MLFGLTLLRNAAIILNTRCIAGMEADCERCLAYVQNSIGLVIALNPVFGYEKTATIAKGALSPTAASANSFGNKSTQQNPAR